MVTPPTPKSESILHTVSFRLPKPVISRVKSAAQKLDIDMSEFYRLAIDILLEASIEPRPSRKQTAINQAISKATGKAAKSIK